MSTLSHDDQLSDLLKQTMGYSEEIRHCEKCLHSHNGGAEGFDLYCNLNPAVAFKVSDRGTCRHFHPKRTTGELYTKQPDGSVTSTPVNTCGGIGFPHTPK